MDEPDEDFKVCFSLNSYQVFLRYGQWSGLFLVLEKSIVEEDAVPGDAQDSGDGW